MTLSRFIMLKAMFPTAIPDALLWMMSGSNGDYAYLTDAITNGALSSTRIRVVKYANDWRATVGIVPDYGYICPRSSSDITVTTTATGVTKSYDSETGVLTLIFSTKPALDVEATITATCPTETYTGAKLGMAVLGTMILGTE